MTSGTATWRRNQVVPPPSAGQEYRLYEAQFQSEGGVQRIIAAVGTTYERRPAMRPEADSLQLEVIIETVFLDVWNSDKSDRLFLEYAREEGFLPPRGDPYRRSVRQAIFPSALSSNSQPIGRDGSRQSSSRSLGVALESDASQLSTPDTRPTATPCAPAHRPRRATRGIGAPADVATTIECQGRPGSTSRRSPTGTRRRGSDPRRDAAARRCCSRLPAAARLAESTGRRCRRRRRSWSEAQAFLDR